MDTSEIPGELSLGNTISSQLKMTHFFLHGKRSLLLWLHNKPSFSEQKVVWHFTGV